MHYISRKATNRYLLLMVWLRKESIVLNEFSISTIYRADVEVRRMISRILKPIELKIQAHTIFWLIDKKITIQELTNRKFYENWSNFKNSKLARKRKKSFNFIKNSILGISEKGFCLTEIFEELSFGQLASFIELLEIKNIQILLNTKLTKKKLFKGYTILLNFVITLLIIKLFLP